MGRKENFSLCRLSHSVGVQLLSLAEDLAVDWVANNLYWTDTLNRRLEVLDLDTKHSAELLQTGAHSAPKAIVVDPNTR